MAEMILLALMQAGRSINNPFAMNSGYVLPKRGDAQADLAKVVADMHSIGKDLDKKARQETKRLGR